jgi:ubiquinone/menaquinone biosynthesis C-methylase UbiE
MLGLAQLSPQARVLDIGCGAGNFLAQIPISQKIGIDIAPTQLQFAKESTGADVLMADAGKLPFRAASFDVVFCSEVIEHMPYASAEKMLTEIHRVLKPQGKLILTTPNYASAWKWLEKAGALISKVDFNKAHIAHYTIPLLQQLMHAHQFVVAHTETMLGFSPFVAFSPTLAQRCVQWEEKNLGKNGFIILMCAQKN